MNQLSIFDQPEPARPPRRLTRSDAKQGRKLAEQGAERAADGAEADNEGWKRQALDFFIAYGRKQGRGAEFATEDVRHASVGTVPVPKNARAWGHVALKAKAQDFIEWARFEPSKDPKSHRCPGNVWRWIEVKQDA